MLKCVQFFKKICVDPKTAKSEENALDCIFKSNQKFIHLENAVKSYLIQFFSI